MGFGLSVGVRAEHFCYRLGAGVGEWEHTLQRLPMMVALP